MFTERTLASLWSTSIAAETPVFNVNFMPLNHIAGRLPLVASFLAGGTSYFVAESDLSTLFDDWALVRPTDLMLVPRVVEMLFQRYRSAVDRGILEGADIDDAEAEAIAELREQLLGGRVLGVLVTTAPLSAELAAFLDSCLDLHVANLYSLTEVVPVTRDNIITRPPVIDYKLIDVPELGYFTTDKPYPRGELLVKSANTTPGYYKRPDVTAEVFRRGRLLSHRRCDGRDRARSSRLCRPAQKRPQARPGRVRGRGEPGSRVRRDAAGAPDLRLRQQRTLPPAGGDRPHRGGSGAVRRRFRRTEGRVARVAAADRDRRRAAVL